ncbi:MAG: hypothetical protein USCGTAYLOR_02362 [Chromatiales bacterium USCg_Taylor]|nr:MAG: hypothetical protein USCGTAYLOR_02362 [Chromatiales bacterium USCg_Taylor]
MWPADRVMEPWIPILWFLYHLAVIAYFQWRLYGEERERERKRQARRDRLLALGFLRTRQSPKPRDEIVMLA